MSYVSVIDWPATLGSACWISGLALILAVLSLYAARAGDLSPSQHLNRALANRWVYAGFLLLAVGRVLAGSSVLEAAIWGLLGLCAIYLWVSRSSDRPAPAATEEQTSPSDLPTTSRTTALHGLAERIIGAEILVLGLFSPFFVFPTPAGTPSLAILPALWIVRRIARGRFVPRTPLDWPITLLLIMVLVSVLVSPDVGFSLNKVAGIIFGVAFYYALVEWVTTPGRLRWAVAAYVLAGFALTVLGLLGTDFGAKLAFLAPLTGQLSRLLQSGAASGFNPNEVAGALLWFLPLELALLAHLARTKTRRRPAAVAQSAGLFLAAALAAVTIVLTVSRSAASGVVVGITLLLWLALPRLRRVLALVPIAVLIGLSYAVLAAGGAPGSRPEIQSSPAAEPDTLQLRTEIWQRALYAIEDFPITGTGMNMFRRLVPLLYPMFSIGPDKDIAHAHNHLLQAALDLGLPGLVAYTALWIVAAVLAVEAWRAARDGRTRALAAGLAASLLAYFVYGLTDAIALGAKPGVVFWALLALLIVVHRGAPGQASAVSPER